MKPLAQRVVDNIRSQELLKAGHRTAIAVSGGLDSVALLRLALEFRNDLGIVLSVVHFNHQLRGDAADADQQFVADLVQQHDLQFHCQAADVRRHSLEKHLSLEAAARELRYAFFHRLIQSGALDRIATAHTLDDQAETVILRLARGAGTRGLGGIYPLVGVDEGAIVRPLLRTRRVDLEAYLHSLDQEWREDLSNADLRHTRNRVRHSILPALERDLNPNLREVLAETADLAREEEAYWEQEVAAILPKVTKAGQTLKISELIALPVALQRRIVRHLAESLGLTPELKHIREILQVAHRHASSVDLPGGWSVIRDPSELRFEPRIPPHLDDYEYALSVPGTAEVPEAKALFAAVVCGPGELVSDAEEWLDASVLETPLTIRNWRPGDRFWPANSKAAKKIKELLQERRVGGRVRKLWPLVASGTDIVWPRGFPVSREFRVKQPGQLAVAIRERPL